MGLRNSGPWGAMLLLGLLGLVYGCNSTSRVRVGELPPEAALVSIETFNEDVRGRNVAIKFDEEYEYKTGGVSFSDDSLQYTDTATGLPTKVHWKEVRFVRRKHRLGGAVEMAILSIPLAILIGMDKGGVGGEVRKGGGFEGALITIGAGAVLGFGIGHDILYNFNNTDEE